MFPAFFDVRILVFVFCKHRCLRYSVLHLVCLNLEKHHYQPTKQRQWKILKLSFDLSIVKTELTMSCHLESKLYGAFNFIEMFALELCTNSHNLIKMTQHVTPQTRRQKCWGKEIQMEAMWYKRVALYIKNQRHDFIMKNVYSKFLM